MESDVSLVRDMYMDVLAEVSKVVVGAERYVRLLMIALLARGHIIVEGVPGIAKTLLAKSFGRSLGLVFRRVQFTPDLLPADVTGGYVFGGGGFVFREGPVFANIVLADEINRAPPKTQAALLEAMQEGQVTVEGETHPLPKPFTVIATQNPIEYEGTYPLPEAQLDRFMFRVVMGYPDPEEEVEVIMRGEMWVDERSVKVVASREEVLRAIEVVRDGVYVDGDVRKYVLRIVQETRRDKRVLLGASPRAAVMLMNASKANAAIEGRGYVTPDDVKRLVFPTLNHRIILRLEYVGGVEDRVAGYRTVRDVLEGVLRRVEPPR